MPIFQGIYHGKHHTRQERSHKHCPLDLKLLGWTGVQTCTYNKQGNEMQAPGARSLGNEGEGKFILTAEEGVGNFKKPS